MDASIPESVRQWMRSTDDPWNTCERADWFVYVAHHQGYPVRHIAQALARHLPPIPDPAELRDLTEPLRELAAACASGERPRAVLEETIRLEVRPRIVDWNVARQFHGPSVPESIPRRATVAEEPVRASANATLRIWRVLESDDAGEKAWPGLVLVAQYLMFCRTGQAPLYNHVEADAAFTTDRGLCDALRVELHRLGRA